MRGWRKEKEVQEVREAEKKRKSCLPVFCSDSSCLAVDPSKPFHYRWLVLVTIAILYNLVFMVGRAVFWELNNLNPLLWYSLDYSCDFIYLLDIVIHAHEEIQFDINIDKVSLKISALSPYLFSNVTRCDRGDEQP
ncbi:hypothetical protein O3M35_001704 [Rhynocoris fuscipes]|uniref:Uncharacterized protein n=1 Tax=Rhynocoris fuscipes TaxID=488301 RepID=A0AAW1CVY8_9HEMI